jgi:hypothetical protein
MIKKLARAEPRRGVGISERVASGDRGGGAAGPVKVVAFAARARPVNQG